MKRWKVRITYGLLVDQQVTYERITSAEGPYLAVAWCILQSERRNPHFITCEEIKPEGA